MRFCRDKNLAWFVWNVLRCDERTPAVIPAAAKCKMRREHLIRRASDSVLSFVRRAAFDVSEINHSQDTQFVQEAISLLPRVTLTAMIPLKNNNNEPNKHARIARDPTASYKNYFPKLKIMMTCSRQKKTQTAWPLCLNTEISLQTAENLGQSLIFEPEAASGQRALSRLGVHASSHDVSSVYDMCLHKLITRPL